MSKIQDVPFITKVIDTLSDELKSGLYDLIDGQVKTPIFRSLVNNDYAITEANDKGKVQFVTLETLRGNYTGYLVYNSVYCVLIAFKGNTQALDMLNINVAKHTFAFVNESLSILELRVELEDGKEGVTPTDLGVTNNNIHLAKGTTQIGEGVNLKTINGASIMGDGNIVVGEGGTIVIDETPSTTSENALMNKAVTAALDLKQDTLVSGENIKTINGTSLLGSGNYDFVNTGTFDPTSDNPAGQKSVYNMPIQFENIVDSHGNKRFVEGNGKNAEIEGVTSLYSKWSLSGTHLMLVYAFKLDGGYSIPYSVLSYFNIPTWIYNKINILFGTSSVGDIETHFTNLSNNQQAEALQIRIMKYDKSIRFMLNGSIGSAEYDRVVRIQFDLLIDSE